jgi:hypothetical protein
MIGTPTRSKVRTAPRRRGRRVPSQLRSPSG